MTSDEEIFGGMFTDELASRQTKPAIAAPPADLHSFELITDFGLEKTFLFGDFCALDGLIIQFSVANCLHSQNAEQDELFIHLAD
jgi:hypothetical protein